MASLDKIVKNTPSQSKSSVFSGEEDDLLIDLVEQNPTLYDLQLESYKDIVKRENIWKEIGAILKRTGMYFYFK